MASAGVGSFFSIRSRRAVPVTSLRCVGFGFRSLGAIQLCLVSPPMPQNLTPIAYVPSCARLGVPGCNTQFRRQL